MTRSGQGGEGAATGIPGRSATVPGILLAPPVQPRQQPLGPRPETPRQPIPGRVPPTLPALLGKFNSDCHALVEAPGPSRALEVQDCRLGANRFRQPVGRVGVARRTQLCAKVGEGARSRGKWPGIAIIRGTFGTASPPSSLFARPCPLPLSPPLLATVPGLGRCPQAAFRTPGPGHLRAGTMTGNTLTLRGGDLRTASDGVGQSHTTSPAHTPFAHTFTLSAIPSSSQGRPLAALGF